MSRQLNTYLLILFVLLYSCKKEDNTSDENKEQYSLSGVIQKGPFNTGSNLTIFEIGNNFVSTGLSFHTTTDNVGHFELNDISLASPYVEILADGFYYNEISGELSDERISLKGFIDLTNQPVVNINVLTDLEYNRVNYLISDLGYNFQEAKSQAFGEVLKIFSLDTFLSANPETFDITHSEEGDAILLAISSILQGNTTTSGLSNLLSTISDDIKEDGTLDDTLLQNTLLGNALALNTESIKQNLLSRYSGSAITLTEINDFERYIDYFISHCGYHFSSPFEYPATTANGLNVLAPGNTEFQLITRYAFAVNMPDAGRITIKVKRTEGQGFWSFYPFECYGWSISNYNSSTNEQTFTSNINGETIDVPFEFVLNGKAIVEYYYNGSESPSFTKIISWGAENNTDFIFPSDSPAGLNLLNMTDNSQLISDSSYTIGLRKPGNWDVDFVLSYSEGISFEIPGGWGTYNYEESEGQILITLSGKDDGDYISEIILHVLGTGTMNLSSADLEISEGVYLDRDFDVN